MKILFTPTWTIVPQLSEEQRARILDAAGPGSEIVVTEDENKQRDAIVDADVLFGRVSRSAYVANKQLKYYQSIGAGVDETLVPELVESDVVFCSEKGGVGIHLAEHAFALLLGLTRGIHKAIREPSFQSRRPIRADQRELFESTLGVLGFGGTGREAAKRALGFGMRVLAVDVEPVAGEPGVNEVWGLDRIDDLLAQSDVVLIGLPLTPRTNRLFNRETFGKMKRNAILINVTRGEIIDGEALLEAINEGVIWGAGIDVTDPEPLPDGHPLWSHPRVIVTPHTAGGSPRRADRVIDTLCENLRRLRAGQPLVAVIDKRKGY
ncbi:MAG: D-2-hydroxyacid dehydrogenase [Chloroflexi bacterium]|nr:D-2-hydroxyacid dehydrogenase [Chloroflexota bacterium]